LSTLSLTAQYSQLDRTIRLGEFIISALIFLGIIVGVYVNIENKATDQGVRIKHLEDQYQKLDTKSDKILDKIETLTIFMASEEGSKRK
jgi:uncharacterized protein YxeA